MYFKSTLTLIFFIIYITDIKSQEKEIVQVGSTNGIVYCFSLLDQGKRIALTSERDIKIFNISDHKNVLNLSGMHTGKILTMDITGDNLKLISGGMDSSVVIWNLKDGKVLKRISVVDNIITRVRINPSGDLLAVGTNHGIIYVYDLNDYHVLKEIKAHKDEITDIEYKNDSTYMVSSGADKAIKFWDIKTYSQLAEINNLKNWVRDLHFNTDNSLLVACGDDARIHKWKITSLDSIRELSSKKYGFHWLMSIDFTNNDKTMVVSGMDGIVRVVTDFGIYKYKIRKPVTSVKFLPTDKNKFIMIFSTLGKGVIILNGTAMHLHEY